MQQKEALTLDEYIIKNANPLTFSAPIRYIEAVRERWIGGLQEKIKVTAEEKPDRFGHC